MENTMMSLSLFAEDGALLYEGQLYKGKPYGKGVVY